MFIHGLTELTLCLPDGNGLGSRPLMDSRAFIIVVAIHPNMLNILKAWTEASSKNTTTNNARYREKT